MIPSWRREGFQRLGIRRTYVVELDSLFERLIRAAYGITPKLYPGSASGECVEIRQNMYPRVPNVKEKSREMGMDRANVLANGGGTGLRERAAADRSPVSRSSRSENSVRRAPRIGT